MSNFPNIFKLKSTTPLPGLILPTLPSQHVHQQDGMQLAPSTPPITLDTSPLCSRDMCTVLTSYPNSWNIWLIGIYQPTQLASLAHHLLLSLERVLAVPGCADSVLRSYDLIRYEVPNCSHLQLDGPTDEPCSFYKRYMAFTQV